jgi:hypothetical protein
MDQAELFRQMCDHKVNNNEAGLLELCKKYVPPIDLPERHVTTEYDYLPLKEYYIEDAYNIDSTIALVAITPVDNPKKIHICLWPIEYYHTLMISELVKDVCNRKLHVIKKETGFIFFMV